MIHKRFVASTMGILSILWFCGNLATTHHSPDICFFDQEFQNNLLVGHGQVLDFTSAQTNPPEKVVFSKMANVWSNGFVTLYAGDPNGSTPKIDFANQPLIKSVVIVTPPKTKLEYSNINPKTRIVCKFSWTKNPREMTTQKISSILANLPRFPNMLVCKNLSTRLIGGKMEEFLIYCKIIIGWYKVWGDPVPLLDKSWEPVSNKIIELISEHALDADEILEMIEEDPTEFGVDPSNHFY